jgi:hypothetical protein
MSYALSPTVAQHHAITQGLMLINVKRKLTVYVRMPANHDLGALRRRFIEAGVFVRPIRNIV